MYKCDNRENSNMNMENMIIDICKNENMENNDNRYM